MGSRRVESPDGGEPWPTPSGGWPGWLWRVPYRGSAHPGASEPGPIEDGANCQRYAYAVLALFGRTVPPVRSSELWAIGGRSPVGRPEPLDLILLNRSDEAYGAHVGVWMAEGRILHLCAELGRPAVWTMAELRRRPRYRTVVGFVRIGDGGQRPVGVGQEG